MTLERYDAIGPLAPEWEELAQTTAASPLMRPGWFEAWWKAFGSGRLEIAALRRSGRLVAVLPLCRRHFGIRSLFNWHQLEFALVADDDDARERLFASLFREERRPVSIRFLEREGPDYAPCVKAAQAQGCGIVTRVLERSPYVEVGDGDWKRYLASLERRRVADLRRRRRRLEELGELTFRVSDGSDRLDADLAAGFALEGSGWKQAAIAADPTLYGFYSDVAHWAADRGWLRLAFLELDGVPFAFALLLQANRKAFQLKGGYDPDKRKFAPGILLRAEMLERAFLERMTRFEILGAEDPDKLIWTRTVHERMAIEVFPHSPLGAAGKVAEVYGRPLARRARAAVRR